MTGKELEKIYNEAYKAVYWTAMSLLKNEADAEDIVQDTFVSFMESYSDMTDTTKATALLKKIAANKCLDRIKLAKTDTMDEEFFDNVEAIPEDFLPDSIVESDEMRKIVMNIINNSLSEDVRRTLILFYFDEMSTKEIAEALGIPQGSVLRRLNFARNKIKKEVEKYEDENDTKLFGMAIPFLSKLFFKESEQVAFKPMPASLSNLSASVKAPENGAGIKASVEAVKKGTDIMKTKILIGSIAGVVAVGATVGIIVGIASKKADTKTQGKPDIVTEELLTDDAVYDDYDYEDYTESEQTTEYDVNSINWEAAYKWEGTAIVGLSENFTNEMREAGIAVIPAKCTEIGTEWENQEVFNHCSWLKEVRFEKPENITIIHYNTFTECKNLKEFVMPPNACLFDPNYAMAADRGCCPFGNIHGAGFSTDLKSLVLPNGTVYVKFLTNLSGDPAASNQLTLDELYVPANFGVKFSEMDSNRHRFAKYSEDFFNKSDLAGLTSYHKNDGVPCKVYVVKGSWADEHFEEWTYGDMIVKEYWDGVNR